MYETQSTYIKFLLLKLLHNIDFAKSLFIREIIVSCRDLRTGETTQLFRKQILLSGTKVNRKIVNILF